MADYSGTPLSKKLGIREGAVVVTVGAPSALPSLLDPLPAGVKVSNRSRREADIILFFTTRMADLARRFEDLAARLAPDGGLWVAYPKKSSGAPTDLTFSSVQEVGLEGGLVDNKSCAIDDTWSGVRFVIRLADRPK